MGNVNISGAIDFHRQQGVRATVTAVTPPGGLAHSNLLAIAFLPSRKNRWEMADGSTEVPVLNPSVLELIDGDSCLWEAGPVERLSQTGQLAVWRHDGFWQGMDTLRDRNHLEELWASGTAPWKNW